jgi:oligopeptide transport system permease protein
LGLIVSAINILIGVIWGSISGYFGGITDIVMERIVDILNGIPWIVLMTVIVLKMGSNLFTFALALCLTGWIGTESVTRSQFYRYRDREYVLAARTLGAKSPRLIFRHILPNAIGTIVTSSILMIPSVIFSEATISYLGLGLRGIASLGVILSDNQKVFQSYPFELVVPAVIISLLMICFNLFGNGLRDAFNPSLKGDD